MESELLLQTKKENQIYIQINKNKGLIITYKQQKCKLFDVYVELKCKETVTKIKFSQLQKNYILRYLGMNQNEQRINIKILLKKLNIEFYSNQQSQQLLGGGCGQSTPAYGPKEQKILQENFQNQTISLTKANKEQYCEDDNNIIQRINDIADREQELQKISQLQCLQEFQQILIILSKIKNIQIILNQTQNQMIEIIQKFISLYLAFQHKSEKSESQKNIINNKQFIKIVKSLITKIKDICSTEPFLHILYYFDLLKNIMLQQYNQTESVFLQNYTQVFQKGLFGIVFLEDSEIFLKVIAQVQGEFFSSNSKNLLTNIFEFKEEVLLNLIKHSRANQTLQFQPHMILDFHIFSYHKVFQGKIIQESSQELVCYALQQIYTLVYLIKNIVFDNGKKYSIDQSKHLIPFLEDSKYGVLKFTKTCSFAEKIGVDIRSYLTYSKIVRYFCTKILLLLVEIFEEQKKTSLQIYDKICDHLYILLFLEKSPFINSLLYSNQSAKKIFQEKSQENQKNLSSEIISLNQRQQQIKLQASEELQKPQKRKVSSITIQQLNQIDSLKNLKQENFSQFLQSKLIESWRESIRRKRQQGIIEKDDELIETVEYYIEQGFKQFNLEEINEFDTVNTNENVQNDNIFQFIIDKINLDDQNINQNYAKLFVIVGEEGFGKSILLKKIELSLIQNEQNTQHLAIPIMISFSDLKKNSFSLEKTIEECTYFLSSTNLSVETLKKSNYQKLILLDGFQDAQGVFNNLWQDLNLNSWKNTKIILACRDNDYHAIYNKNYLFNVPQENIQSIEKNQKNGYLVLFLQQFNESQILRYFKKYFYLNYDVKKSFKLQQIAEQLFKKQKEIYQLIQIPINLYFYTRLIGQESNDKDLQLERFSSIQNSFQLQEKFIYFIFERQIQYSHQLLFQKLNISSNQEKEQIKSLLIDQYFYYFENASLYLFNKKRSFQEEVPSNYSLNEIPVKILSDLSEFMIKKQRDNLLSQKDELKNQNESNTCLEEYELSNSIKKYFETSSLLEIKQQSYKKLWCSDYEQVITFEFKHSSIMELFVARALIRDFINETSLSIRNLNLTNLNNFAVNSIYIITPHSQYEQDQLGFGILNKFCLLIKEEIKKEEQLNQNVKKTQDLFNEPRNNKFIEYIQRTRDRDVMKMKLKHQLDVGSSNLLSALCQLKYNLSGVDLSFCSFSCAYLFDYKGKSLNFTGSNLSCANISNSSINSTLSRTENCILWKELVIFDSFNQFSFSKIKYFPDDSNIILCGSNTGYINIYCFDKNKRILLTNSNVRSRDNSQDAKYLSQQSLQNSPKQQRAQTDMVRSKSKSPKQRALDCQKSLNYFIRPGTSQSVRSNIEQVQNQLKLSQVQINNSLYNSITNLSQVSQNDDYQIISSNFQDSQLLKSKNYFKGAINDIEDYFNTIIVSQNSNVLCLHRDTLDLLSMLQAHDIGEIRISLCKSKHILATISLLESTCKIWQINKQKGFLLIQKIDEQLESCKHLMSAVKFSSDGKYLALGCTDTYLRIYCQSSSNTFVLLQTIKSYCQSPISHLVFSSNSQYLALGGQLEEKHLTIFELTFENSFYPIKVSQEKENRCLQIVQFTPNCRYMVTSFQKNGLLQLWLLSKSKVIYVDCIQAFQDGCSVSSISFYYQQNLTIDSVLEDAGNTLMCVGSNDSQILKTFCIRDNKFILKEQKIIGHEKKIEQIALSKSCIVSISNDKTCILWNYSQFNQQFEQVQVLPYQVLDELSKLEIQHATFSPNNKFFAITTKKKGKDDSFCQVYFLDDEDKNILDIKKENLCLKIQSKNISCICFSLDTQFLALADSERSSISIFRLETKEKIFEIPFDNKGQNDIINSNISYMQYSKNNKYLYAVISEDSKVCYLWDVSQQYHEIASIKLGKSNNRIIGTKITPDNNILRIITSRGELRSFNIQNNLDILQKQYFQLEGRSTISNSIDFQYIFSSFSQDCNYVAIGTKKQVEVWSLEQTQLQLVHVISENILQLLHVQFIQNSLQQICVVDQEKRIRIFDLSQAIKKQKFNPQYIGHTAPIIQVEYSLGTSQFLLTTSSDNVSKLWNSHKGYQLIQTFQNTKQIHINSSEDILVIVPSDPMKNEILFLDIQQNFEIIHTLQNPKKISKVCFSPNLQVIATCQQDSVKLRNYSREEIVCIQELNCIDFAEIIKFSIDSVYIAASFGNGQLQVWKKERNQYQFITNLTCNSEDKKFINVNSLAFSNNKKFLAAAFSNKRIIVWSIEKQNLQIRFEENLVYGSALNILFSSNNTQLISQDEDYSIKVWDIKNDQFSKLEQIKHNNQTPYNTNKNSFSSSMDFKYLAIGYNNSSLEIWNIEQGIIYSLKQKNTCLEYVI
ncbi:NACHT domain protein (macronuclear) [Tetrahymena thermophila SB210]|uniref:NACHT domain protein n=1 Tax=Tetrahymena thermophila (strain SB210) TaxID=312017 RepID=Q23D30_TETTS|nr:NACHT domain protein [Tetrahymena thermophila SB210]EAR94325.2 NACHT domain protein [Tetrahymena thermophila SB210]|eukprot:XP_001014856.2 NACHT domain protein [Tetrahymena thermophila SB210]